MRMENQHAFWGERKNEQKRKKVDEKRILAKSSLIPHHQKNPITAHSASQKVGRPVVERTVDAVPRGYDSRIWMVSIA